MTEEETLVFVTVAVVVAAIVLVWMAMANRRRIREMAHRERMAMIDRGLMPPPEIDPAAFESRAGLPPSPDSRAALRSRSAGVMLIGFGLALMLLITLVAQAPEIGVGVGGAFALLGGAFLFNAVLLGRHAAHFPAAASPPQPISTRSEPPPTVTP